MLARLPLLLFVVTGSVMLWIGVFHTSSVLVVMTESVGAERKYVVEPTPLRGLSQEQIVDTNLDKLQRQIQSGMQVTVSLLVMGATLFVILSKKYAARDKNWAYGALGIVIGFWLKP